MKDSQKGFSVVEGLLIFVIIGVIGFVGWYVWQSTNKANKSLDAAANTNLTTPAKSAADSPQTTNTADWKTYVSIEKEAFSIKYPNNWTTDSANKPRQYSFKTSDFRIGIDEARSTAYMAGGAILDVNFGPMLGGYSSLKDYIQSKHPGFETTTLNGVEAYIGPVENRPYRSKGFAIISTKGGGSPMLVSVNITTTRDASSARMDELKALLDSAASTFKF